MSLPSLTEKDDADIDLAIALDFDFLALSFVQSADDVRELQRRLAARGADIPVIAKIEMKSALDDIEAIAAVAGGVMVARGDLALEMSLPEVPIAQKRIIAACRQAACPVITATQMLESMTTAPKPTRAEATDVANAIFDGTDAVMLSGEIGHRQIPRGNGGDDVRHRRARGSGVARRRGAVAAAAARKHEPRRDGRPRRAQDRRNARRAGGHHAHVRAASTTRRVCCHRAGDPGAGAVHEGTRCGGG